MKRLVLLFTITLITFISCSRKQNALLDLTQSDEDSVYEEVFNMCIMSEKYEGKTIRLNGTFNSFIPNEKTERVFMIVVNDKHACCKQGIEFKPATPMTYPDDFPPLDSKITLTGNFIHKLTEEGYDYFYLELIDIEM